MPSAGNYLANTVTIHDGPNADIETLKRARLQILGESPEAAAVLSVWDQSAMRYRRVDRVTNARITESHQRVTVVGVSDFLVETVRLRPKDAEIRWELDLKECQTCG